MPRDVAYGHLVAAAEAWPFVSDAAFRRCAVRLTRTPYCIFDRDTRALADDLETWSRPRASGLSLEALYRLCDQAWFDDSPADLPLAEALGRLAHRTLEPCGTDVVVRRDHDFAQRIEHFRWLSLLLPPDLLIAAVYAGSPFEPPANRVTLSTPELQRLLTEAPVAETHLHLGAAISFSLLWTGLVGSLAGDAPEPHEFPREPEPPPFGSADRFIGMLAAGAIARTLTASFLWQRGLFGHPAAFDIFLECSLSTIGERAAWPWGAEATGRELRRTVRGLIHGDLSLGRPRLLSLYRHLVCMRRRSGERDALVEVIARDPLAAWLAPSDGAALPETRFLFRALGYLLGPGRDDTAFAKTFWQYQRVRNLTYRYVTQEPGTAGLDWFNRHYRRISPLRRLHHSARFESALALESSGLRLGAIEVRSAPDRSWCEVRSLVRDIAGRAARAPAPRAERPEVGIVLHFLKDLTWRHGDVERLHADPRQVAYGVRFGAWGHARLEEAMAIESALEHSPDLLLVLRGLDVASTELAVPTWAVLPIIARARRASVRASARLARLRPGWQAPPLQMTFHAGEDFRRLSEGLRRVHELMEFGVLQPGDRIGHGLALGCDPKHWVKTASETGQPAEERLDDLLWSIDRCARGDLGCDAGFLAWMRAEVLRIGRWIYDSDDVEVERLLEARRLRHDLRTLDRIGYPFLRSGHFSGIDRYVHRYLTETGVFVRGQRLESVRATAAEVTFLRVVQAWLCAEVGRMAITVESNPSSNLLIGDMISVDEHPAFRLQPLPGTLSPIGSTVALSLNADDPLTFATALADEYAFVYAALLRAHVPAAEALGWLAGRRDHGYRARFTLSASKRLEDLASVEASGRGPMQGQPSRVLNSISLDLSPRRPLSTAHG